MVVPSPSLGLTSLTLSFTPTPPTPRPAQGLSSSLWVSHSFFLVSTSHHYPSFRYHLLWGSLSFLAVWLCLPLCFCVPLFLDPVPLSLSRLSGTFTSFPPPPPTCCCSLQGPSGGTLIHPAQPTSAVLAKILHPQLAGMGWDLLEDFLSPAWLPFSLPWVSQALSWI